MKSDGLTQCPVFPQSVCPFLRPCINEKQACVCLVSTMACPAHAASSHCTNHIVISLKLHTVDCILQDSKWMEI